MNEDEAVAEVVPDGEDQLPEVGKPSEGMPTTDSNEVATLNGSSDKKKRLIPHYYFGKRGSVTLQDAKKSWEDRDPNSKNIEDHLRSIRLDLNEIRKITYQRYTETVVKFCKSQEHMRIKSTGKFPESIDEVISGVYRKCDPKEDEEHYLKVIGSVKIICYDLCDERWFSNLQEDLLERLNLEYRPWAKTHKHAKASIFLRIVERVIKVAAVFHQAGDKEYGEHVGAKEPKMKRGWRMVNVPNHSEAIRLVVASEGHPAKLQKLNDGSKVTPSRKKYQGETAMGADATDTLVKLGYLSEDQAKRILSRKSLDLSRGEPSEEQIMANLKKANAVALEASAVNDGQIPIGAILVDKDHETVLMEQGTESLLNRAELLLVQAAVKKYTPEQLWSYTLYSTLEPCAMGAGAVYWGNIGRVVYGMSQHELLEIAGEKEECTSLDVPCKLVLENGRKDVRVYGPMELPDIKEDQEKYWKDQQVDQLVSEIEIEPEGPADSKMEPEDV